MSLYQQFYQLHHSPSPVLIGNVWDAGSAKLFQQAGLKALATSSAALANTYGFEDGENIPFELLLETVKHIQKQITIPLSVDMEGGYSDSLQGIADNLDKLCDMGVVGINIEDSINNQLLPPEQFAKKLDFIANHLAQKNTPLYINARIDPFLLKHPKALEESITRSKLYEQSGASGAFVPFIHKADDIASVVQATKLPLNVLAMQQLPGFDELERLGVKRISMGSAVYRKMIADLAENITAIQWDKSFNCLY